MWKPEIPNVIPCDAQEIFFFNDTATTEIYTLSLHDALPISFFDARRTRGGGTGFRHQRQHGSQTAEIASGRGRILPDLQHRGRVLPGGVQRPAEAGSAAHA